MGPGLDSCPSSRRLRNHNWQHAGRLAGDQIGGGVLQAGIHILLFYLRAKLFSSVVYVNVHNQGLHSFNQVPRRKIKISYLANKTSSMPWYVYGNMFLCYVRQWFLGPHTGRLIRQSKKCHEWFWCNRWVPLKLSYEVEIIVCLSLSCTVQFGCSSMVVVISGDEEYPNELNWPPQSAPRAMKKACKSWLSRLSRRLLP